MIGVFGISHKTAPINIREIFAVNKARINDLAEYFSNSSEISELVILSTCNRTEVYFCLDKLAEEEFQKLISLFHLFLNLSEDYSSFFYTYSNNRAVKHLFSVTSGLDSLVVGEYQIVCQVKEAYTFCTDNSWTDAILMRLFQKSFETSKLVRSKTLIQQGAISISYLAVDRCQDILGRLEDKSVLFVGTGETGRLVLQKMKKMGISEYGFTNRTKASMEELAKEVQGCVIDFSSFSEQISNFDIVVTATDAGKFLICPQDIEKSAKIRNNKKQIFVDLSVPRNIHFPEKKPINSEIIVIDDLYEIVETNTTIREESIHDAKIIISEMTDSFFTWYKNRTLKPVIQSIKKNIECIHRNELDDFSVNYTNETLNAVNQYATHLTRKYIRKIIKNLVDLNEKGEAGGSLETIKELFIFEPKSE
jgi:glutamyl-tRNA reductase